MKPPPHPGILLVAAREFRWMRRDGLALFLATGVPLIAFAILALTFRQCRDPQPQCKRRRCGYDANVQALCPGDFVRVSSGSYASFKHTDGRDARNPRWRGYRGGLYSPAL